MRTKRIVTLTVTSISALLVTFSGVMKAIKWQPFQIGLNSVGAGKYMVLLGLTEITLMALFLYPKTMKAGFLLLSCFFAGAMATELTHNGKVIPPLVQIVILWIAAVLRDRSMFLNVSDHSEVTSI